MNRAPKLLILAGEASGDLLGAGVMAALKQLRPDVQFVGVGGPAMEAEGLRSVFPMRELSVMGLVEVLPHLPRLMRRIDQMVDVARIERVDGVLTIDSPDFCLRVAKKIKADMGVPCVHYVSPQVWAWRKGRVRKMARYLDHVLALFPFEPACYEGSGLPCTFVGHPVAERLAGRAPSVPRPLHTPRRLALLPGSRVSEIRRMMPPFVAAAQMLAREFSGLEFVLPLADHFNPRDIEPYADMKFTFVKGDEKFDVLATCDAAIATSGTANLELAMLDLPMVVGYKMSPVSYALANVMVDIPFFCPVNLVADDMVAFEFLQDDANAPTFHNVAKRLLKDSPERAAQLVGLAKVRAKLTTGVSPSQKAAETVLSVLRLPSLRAAS